MKFRCASFWIKISIVLLLLPVTLESQAQNNNSLNVNKLNGQEKIIATSLVEKQIEYIQKLYYGEVEAPKELINGKEYESYYTRSQSKPLLYPDKQRSAVIYTHSRRYSNLTLQYDTFLDEVVYTDTSRTLNYTFPQIALNKDIIEGFKLYFVNDSSTFRYFRPPDCSLLNLKEGFYEIAYEKRSKYVIRHSSSFYVKEGRNEYKYTPENYFSVGGVFYRVKNKAGLLRLFGDKSDEIKKYLHSAHLRIRQADKNQFISILKYYDSLTSASKAE
jgi:hypothetical protein